MSDLVENGVVTQQPAQGASLNGPQQNQIRQQKQTKSASSPNQQNVLSTGQSCGNTQQAIGSMSNMSKVDGNNQLTEHNQSYNKQHQGSGYSRGGGHQHNNTNMSQHHGPTHQQHYNSKHNIINNNNNNQIINSKGDNESNVNHVLLITVINPHYPINCEIIHLICSDYGKVNRIVIFKKNGLQAMVEFDNVESAKRARSSLHGCDIYSGCCTLRVEFAKPTRLNVHKNDDESFDYTNPNLTTSSGDEQEQHPHQPSHHNHQHQASAHHHHPYQNHAMHQHHSKGGHGNMTNRRAMASGDMSNPGSGGHHQQHHLHHPHHTGHFHDNHPKQHQQPMPVQPNSSGQHHHPHMYGISNNQPSSADLGFQQQHLQPQEGFGVSRSSGQIQVAGSSGAPSTTSGQPDQPQSSGYIDADPFAMSSATHGSHGMHASNVFPRHDNQGHHHQQHPHQHHHHHHHHHQGHRMGGGASGNLNHHQHHHHPHHSNHHSTFVQQNAALMAGPAGISPQGTVMMVYGLNSDQVNCDRLFNLFCLYGNVVRVKFLRTKDGCAMVQMGDALAVERCVSSLNKITLFGNELQLSYSKQAFLHDVIQPFILPDGSPSFKDFMGNKNNRFKNPEVASKNRILPPSQVLHFFNAPHGITEEELIHLFKQTAEHEPISLKIFTPKTENSKSNSGLVTFRDPVEATEVLVLCNHLSMPRAGAPHPYILRLCFSPPTYARHPQHQCQQQQQQNQHQSQQMAQESNTTPAASSSSSQSNPTGSIASAAAQASSPPATQPVP